VRRWVRGDDGTVGTLATRLLGSPDLFGHEEREPEQSVHFVTCHDGFTLEDLVSYDRKHNAANGHGDRDGSDENFSWNCGHEGPSDDPQVESLRNRQVKNLLALDLIAVGTPMLLMGDEMRRTQRGNNNAYCLDDETTWLDWGLLERHAGRTERRMSLNAILREGRVAWHGVALGRPDWSHGSHSLAATAHLPDGKTAAHFLFNAWRESLEFELPSPPEGHGVAWRRCLDTALRSPDDLRPFDEAPSYPAPTYRAAPRSIVALVAQAPAPR
jgi:glycogen operon protein